MVDEHAQKPSCAILLLSLQRSLAPNLMPSCSHPILMPVYCSFWRPLSCNAGFATPQRQLADAQNRLNSQRASSGDGGGGGGDWGPGDSVLDLLRHQASAITHGSDTR